MIPLFYPPNANWISSADIPTAIANGGTGFRTQADDWFDATQWISQNTEPDAVIAAWWDYGYWITTLGNRTTIADNATINQTRIETIAKMLISDEQTGIKIAQDLHADYILVYAVGQLQFYGSSNSTASNVTNDQIPIYTLGQGGDESKKQWFMRIGGFDESKYIERDGFTPTPEFWRNTLLGRLFPFEPLSYVRVQGGQIASEPETRWQQGYIGLYGKNVKYPANGGSDQPLELVYSSPSYNDENNRGPVLGIFIYKVNHDYVPKPTTDPYAPAKPDNTTSNEVAVIETAQGTIKMEFFPEAAPNTVENFITLANSGFYDGVLFHRIDPGFVIQGGDPNTKPNGTDSSQWGQGGPGYNIDEEFNSISHERGIVSMARRAGDVNSAGSQFFIVLEDNDTTKRVLDGQYTAFGRVIEGMDVVDKIAALPTVGTGQDSEHPVNPEDARILSVKIEEH